MNELDQLLGEISGSNFERSNFETTHNLATSKVAQALQTVRPEHQAVIVNAIKDAHQMGLNRAGDNGQGMGIAKKVGMGQESAIYSLISESVGDLNLTVTRVGTNFAVALPFVLFGSNDFGSKYASTLKNLTAGITGLTSVTVASTATGDVTFSYVNNAGTDVITITNLGNVNYTTFLNGMNNNFFATKFFELTISDATQSATQFANPLLFGVLSSLGLTNANQLVLRSRQFSWNFQKDKVEVVMPEQKITPDFSFSMSIESVEGLELGFDFYMSKRLNLNNM